MTLAQAQAVPDITASGGFRHFEENGQTAIIAGISIPLPFWDRNKGNITAAQSDTVAADAALAQARLLASFSQRDAKLMLDAAEARLDALKESGLREAEEAARVADVGYRNGKFSLVELIDAQEALTRTKLNIIEAELDRANARAMLVRINKRLGDMVRAGETIATMESRDAAAISSERSAANARLALARSTYAREKKLYDAKVTAKQDLEGAQAVLAEAESEVRRAGGAASALKVSGDGRTLAVVSLISGRITKTDAKLGAYVLAGAELFRVSDPHRVQVNASVRLARRVQSGHHHNQRTERGQPRS